ncbi:MAG: hypothetical protein CEE38_17445 [Planctomycetes bacterium B3_Pla]|nr:MAG: hypothetical protein CEE38_17445 [Planctomycetes bacterium B3_Pla]
MDKTCFVIQPFRNPFNKRYDDVFKDAITNAGLRPYRVDKDPAVSVPIRDIEVGIKNAAICFADITTDDPNVWFELGYALAISKDVCLVCSSERKEKYPFDVQHRFIIPYSVESSSDFEELSRRITEKLIALLKAEKNLFELPPLETGVKASGEMQPHEQAVIISIMKDFYDSDSKSGYLLKQDLAKAGFNELAASLAIASLLKKEMLLVADETDYQGNEYRAFKLTEKAIRWINENQSRFELKIAYKLKEPTSDDDIPF